VPVLQRDDATIHYEEYGSGFPVLTLAPGGMHSSGGYWDGEVWNPVKQLTGFRLITMDQRNAGASTAPVTGAESWATYTADQLAVLDHLGIERCHVVGQCIGGPFILNLLRTAPERVARAVVLQTIGLDDNHQGFHDMFEHWRGEQVASHPEAGPAQWDAYRTALFGGDEVLFSVPAAFLPTIGTPLLVLQGNDEHHPPSVSRLLAGSVPGARLVEQWKGEEHLRATAARIQEFLTGS
jgi:pimeloyl-ACP methyl ester carboxylesterase